MPQLEDPVQPQSLKQVRQDIGDELRATGPTSQRVAGLIRDWQAEVRAWQDGDSLNRAFLEGRLMYRTLSHPNNNYNYGAADDETKRILGIINNDNYTKPLINDVVRGGPAAGGYVKGPQRAANVNYVMNVGGAGMKRMQDPGNFVKTGPSRTSHKFNLGLVDVSACLLDPRGYTTKNYTQMTLVVLLPLPLPEDVSLFYELRRVAKGGGSAAFRSAMEIVATEFVRPRLASSLDMGTQYAYRPAAPGKSASVKYVKGDKATSKDTADQCRLNVLTNYRDILRADVTGANEITVAIRKFGNTNKFPTFAVSQKGATSLAEIYIELAAANSGQFSNFRWARRIINTGDFSVRDVAPASAAAAAAAATASTTH